MTRGTTPTLQFVLPFAALNSAKAYTDEVVGNINSILDAINGEVI